MQSPVVPSCADKAQQACVACKLRKRKCDKGLPQCGWCSSKSQVCDYSSLGQHGNNATSQWSYPSSPDESPRKSQSVDFPTILFMDPTILRYGQIERPRATHPVPTYVLQFVGDMTEVTTNASTYFETVHVWMPIISKKRFYDQHLQPLFHYRPDFTLLLLSMKLITSILPDGLASPRTPAYNAAKHLYLEMEASGMMSVQVLQAGLLLSLYELGHAIYPSAYLSIGACARYAYALGINKDAKTQAIKVLTLVELEENKRVWWGIIILDRFLSIGCPGRPFATGNPKLRDPLPANDAAWDAGVVEPNSATLYSPTNTHMSKFSLLCQTAGLLGQVLDHISSPVANEKMHNEEGMQLDQTLQAMIAVSESMDPPDNDQIGMIYSLPFYSNNMLRSNTDRTQRGNTALETMLKKMAKCLPNKSMHLTENRETVSPWGLYCVYRAAVICMQLIWETGDSGAVENLLLLKQTLNTIRTRWNAAGVYLQLLEVHEVVGNA